LGAGEGVGYGRESSRSSLVAPHAIEAFGS